MEATSNFEKRLPGLPGMTHFFCLPGLATGMADRGKAYTDVLAGTLVLLNSFVMLIELEIEG